MIDSHAHLTFPEYGADAPEMLLDRAGAAGVEHVICVPYDIASNEEVVALAAREPRTSAVVGIHPHEADRVTDGDLARIEELVADPRVVAVGELGLDYYRDYADHGNQRRLFERQLETAARAGKPVVIHDREAHDDVLAILRERSGDLAGGVMHCFSGGEAELERAVDLGFFISIPGPITFAKKPGGRLERVARLCPEDRLLIETDCPWLTPEPHRGRGLNEPAFVRFVLERVAAVRERGVEEMDRITAANTRRLFRLEE
ncbi:MAG: TatD family hydrolase [Candidatus Eisenbacteria bacterium]|nr:TatD family hydrolase [Candidatus Eisenbacteria bacterium]